MNMIKKLLIISITCNLLLNSIAQALYLAQPSETLIRPPYDRHLTYNFNTFLEAGFGFKSFGPHEAVANPLQIWHTQQSALSMLKGFSPENPVNLLSNEIDANDDGVRGRFNLCADFKIPFAAAFNGRFFFLKDWFLSAHLPFYQMQLHNLQFIDQTENNTSVDLRTKTLLTDDIATFVNRFGCIKLDDWKRNGIGDFSLILNWFRDFPQTKEVLKNARVNWRVGLTLPTGKRADLDLLFAQSFGYNGACAIPFGLGLDLMLGNYLQTGVDIQLTHIFGHKSIHRIKTDINQTELFLLQKANAYRDYGLTQRINLYVKMDKFLKGFSFLLGYQFFKHGKDHLALTTNAFSNQIANTAESLKEWTIHHIITNASYDFAEHTWCKTAVVPYISMYTRIPFNGKRSAGSASVGFVVSLDF